ncbi:MAG: UPF0280 family protein [Candidatus Bathyarchaeia archaeon]
MKSIKIYEKRYRYKESILRLRSDNIAAIDYGFKTFLAKRIELEDYISSNPWIKYVLDPVDIDDGMPEVVKRMVSASSIAGVGPLASVAGALADLICESMLELDVGVAVAENGGEASIVSTIPIVLEAYIGSDELDYIYFEIDPCDTPLGVASSSARHGGGISFGIADLATVFAENAALADAAATRLCNLVDSVSRDSIEYALRETYSIPGVKGCFIVVGGYVGCIGWNPKILSVSRRLG